jgi:uncharacterized repeat protein (TIGR01451 family)
VVTNTGTTTLTGIGVSDNLVASVSCPDPSLAPGASETCTGSYTVTQADVDNGSVTNTATANGTAPDPTTVHSNPSSVTVDESGATTSLSVVKSTGATSFSAAGQTLTYSYKVTNTGTTTIHDVNVTDNLIGAVSCSPATLAPGASVTCTGSYTVTQGDVDNGSVTNTATAHAIGPYSNAANSNESSVTVTYSGVVITTTSLPTLTEGSPYSYRLSASGGVAPYTWKSLAGLPKGLSLSAKGVLSGTVKAKKVVPGAYTISVEVTDSTKKGHQKDAVFLTLNVVY